MPRFFFIPALLAITANLFGQSPAPPDGKRTEDALCTVTGGVVTAMEGDPLKSARVSLIPEHNRSHNQIYAASSDSDGHFTINNIPPGSYKFLASHTGFVEQLLLLRHWRSGQALTRSSEVFRFEIRFFSVSLVRDFCLHS